MFAEISSVKTSSKLVSSRFLAAVLSTIEISICVKNCLTLVSVQRYITREGLPFARKNVRVCSPPPPSGGASKISGGLKSNHFDTGPLSKFQVSIIIRSKVTGVSLDFCVALYVYHPLIKNSTQLSAY